MVYAGNSSHCWKVQIYSTCWQRLSLLLSVHFLLLPFLAVLCRLILHFCTDLHLSIGERFPWNFLQTFIGLRELNIMTSVIPWLFSQHQQQVKVFSNSVKYLNIYEMDWHNFLTQIFIVSRLWIIMALVKPLIFFFLLQCCHEVDTNGFESSISGLPFKVQM